MRKTSLALEEGERIPRGYGLVRWDHDLRVGIFLPIPVNLIVRFFERLYWRVVFGFFPDRFEKKLQEAWRRSYKESRVTSYDIGYKDGIAFEKERWVNILDSEIKNINDKMNSISGISSKRIL